MESGVSVIIPLYNREKYIEECIQSVLDQVHEFPIEIIVADDGSTDRSVEIVKSFGAPVVFVEKPVDCMTQGPGPTRNRGVVASQYPFIAFLDSDDLYLPGHLQRLYDVLQKNSEISFVIDQLCGMNSDPQKRWVIPYPDQNEIRLESVFLNPYVSLIVSLIRRSVILESEIFFDEKLVMAEDVDFFLRLLEKHSGVIVPGDGTVVREHDERSIRDIRKTYSYAEDVLKKAIERHPYPAHLIRKRKAVLLFRFAQADLAEKKYIVAVWKLFKAFCYDPVRAIKTVFFKNYVS